jgi:hypothetical protein
MRKNVKRGVVDGYVKQNPNMSASEVAYEIGCHPATVYLARKRLGITKDTSNQQVLLNKIVKLKSENKTQSHVNDLMHEEFNELQKKMDFSSNVNKALGAAVVVLAVGCLLLFIQ